MELYGLDECPIQGLMQQADEIERKSGEAPTAAQDTEAGEDIDNAPQPGAAASSSSGP